MREYLYRGKSLETNDWVYGSLVYSKTENQYYIVEHNDNELSFAVDKHTICEYIGLCNKNGKKIFENDIIVFNKRRFKDVIPYLVKWHDRDCAFQRYPYGKELTIGGAGALLQRDMMSECEIIGNVFDNSELLEVVNVSTKTDAT